MRNAVRCAYARCGFAQRWTGTHVLRHSVASRLLREGASLKDIAHLLRHRTVNTTTIYVKGRSAPAQHRCIALDREPNMKAATPKPSVPMPVFGIKGCPRRRPTRSSCPTAEGQ
ncbi:tyrosine-type recombinase/integrase [Paraburkholderia rhynchosiae]|uniref:tyrosine-type recombinase/integrase n=1 Tax=Paraburkholderia rhynchosiae TaxID=487049 RepID=UPI001304FE7C